MKFIEGAPLRACIRLPLGMALRLMPRSFDFTSHGCEIEEPDEVDEDPDISISYNTAEPGPYQSLVEWLAYFSPLLASPHLRELTLNIGDEFDHKFEAMYWKLYSKERVMLRYDDEHLDSKHARTLKTIRELLDQETLGK